MDDEPQRCQDGSARVEQTIYVTRDSHEKIALGEGGRTIKATGSTARKVPAGIDVRFSPPCSQGRACCFGSARHVRPTE